VNIVTEEDIRPEVFGHLYGLFHSKTKTVDALRDCAGEQIVPPDGRPGERESNRVKQ
jgi:DNA polymerase-3 subunit epsilon